MRIGPQQTIWIAGASGRMGQAIQHQLDHGRYAVYTTDKEIDVTDLNEVTRFAEINRPDIVVNATGIHTMAEGKAERLAAYGLYALGARNLAVASEGVGAAIVQISTDDVFSGIKHDPACEFDAPYPSTVYGKAKLAGERMVRELNDQHIIVRSSWVYGNRPDDWLNRVLEAGRTETQIEVPANQFSCPTSCTTFARRIVDVIESEQFGLFHLADTGSCSRFEWAKAVLENAGLPTTVLSGSHCEKDGYVRILENMMVELTGMPQLPTWQDDLRAFMGANGLLA